MEGLIAGVRACLDDLRFIEEKNQRHEFKASFWQQNSDFNLGRDVLIAASGTISNQVTKFSLVMGKEEVPKEALSVCQALYDPCQQLLSALKVAIFAGAGYALTKELCQATNRILTNVMELSNTLVKREFKRVPEFTGRIWDSCAMMENLSKSNLIATKRIMLQTVSVLNDTVQELDGSLAEAREAKEEDEEVERNVELEDDLDFDMDVSLSPQEINQLALCLDVLKMTQAISKKGVLALNGSDSEDGFVEWGTIFPTIYDEIQEAVVDMGADLCPPFEAEVVSGHIRVIEKIGVKCLHHLQNQPGASNQPDLEKGLQAFQSKVQATLAALEEEESC